MSGNLGGGALGGVGVGDWPYTLGAGLYSGGVAGCWLCTLGDVACWLRRSVKSSVILGGDGLGGRWPQNSFRFKLRKDVC